jgi:hypothetical protein
MTLGNQPTICSRTTRSPRPEEQRKFRLDFSQFEKQKRWRRLSGQDNRENNSAHFSCVHVFTQLGSKADLKQRMFDVRSSPESGLSTALRNVRFVSIVLQKPFCITEHNFSGL